MPKARPFLKGGPLKLLASAGVAPLLGSWDRPDLLQNAQHIQLRPVLHQLAIFHAWTAICMSIEPFRITMACGAGWREMLDAARKPLGPARPAPGKGARGTPWPG